VSETQEPIQGVVTIRYNPLPDPPHNDSWGTYTIELITGAEMKVTIMDSELEGSSELDNQYIRDTGYTWGQAMDCINTYRDDLYSELWGFRSYDC
jgi:hypothetical protein